MNVSDRNSKSNWWNFDDFWRHVCSKNFHFRTCTTYTLKIGPFTNPKLWKPISPFYTFHYHDVQVGVTSRRIVRFQKFKHHYKRENVYFNIIPKTQIRPCAQKSLILTAWVTYGDTAMQHIAAKYKQTLFLGNTKTLYTIFQQ